MPSSIVLTPLTPPRVPPTPQMYPKPIRLLCMAMCIVSLWLSMGRAQVGFPAPELLARPTDHSVTLQVVADTALEAYAEFGTSSGTYTKATATVSASANDPLALVLDSLSANTKYYYRLRYRIVGSGASFAARTEHSFHTQRPPGSTFTFTVISDSHINIVFGNTPLYQQTLTNVLNDSPDFHLDLGDTFAMDYVTSSEGARDAYLFQRSSDYMGTISHSVPIFLVTGNHEQEEGWHLDDNGNPVNSQPVWGTNARKRYFPNPVPDSFYSGNTDTSYALDGDHLHENFYSWTWGNALFVAIDPFWYTTSKPFIGDLGGGESSDPGSGDRWDWTLGKEQYDWLKQTLQTSTATYKFIFAHHMTGGTQDYVRGGAYGAAYCEWGGYNVDGTTWGFDTRRQGWDAPVHQLLVQYGVSAFFHGHDHEFAYEMRDGVVYQLVPMPSDATYGYGFGLYSESNPLTLKVLPNSGHLRVTVSPAQAKVDYVRAYTSGGNNGQIAYSYTISPKPLAIELSWFKAQAVTGQGVLLQWMTLSETDNYGFFVERKRENETQFDDLPGSFVGGNGTTTVPHRYSYPDPFPASGTWAYRLKQIDRNGTIHYSDAVQVDVAKENGGVPRVFTLGQNSPNPFNPSTTIRFSVAGTGNTTLRVYTLLGQVVATLFDGIAEAGRNYSVAFSPGVNGSSGAASGVYIYRLTSGGRSQTRAMVMVK